MTERPEYLGKKIDGIERYRVVVDGRISQVRSKGLLWFDAKILAEDRMQANPLADIEIVGVVPTPKRWQVFVNDCPSPPEWKLSAGEARSLFEALKRVRSAVEMGEEK